MARNRQLPLKSNVDLRVSQGETFATYQLKLGSPSELSGLCHVSSVYSDGFARAFAEYEVSLSGFSGMPESQMLEVLHASTGEPLFHLMQRTETKRPSSFVVSSEKEFSLPALSEHIRFFEVNGIGHFGGGVVESTTAKYVLALSFGVSTVHEFLAAFDGITLSAVKSRIQRARKEGLLPDLALTRRHNTKIQDAG